MGLYQFAWPDGREPTIEHAVIPYSILENAGNYDPALMVKFPGIIFGSVWTGGTTKAPIGGATIEIDPEHGKVLYLDPPNAQGLLGVRSSTSTGLATWQMRSSLRYPSLRQRTRWVRWNAPRGSRVTYPAARNSSRMR